MARKKETSRAGRLLSHDGRPTTRKGSCDGCRSAVQRGARYIAETLTSIQRQTLQASEVIVVDDGSTDGGVSIVRAHPLAPRLVTQDHLGVAVARNRGLALASQPWVTFLDQDDLWLPQRLERLLAWLDRNPVERIVVTTELAFSTTDEADRLHDLDPLVANWAGIHLAHPAYEHLDGVALPEGSGEISRQDVRALLHGPISVTVSLIADQEMLHLAGGFAAHALAMDDYWLLVNVSRIQPIAKLDDPPVLYRVHLNATSRTTRLALPFLTSAVALRHGGGLLAHDDALADSGLGPLHAHLLDEVQRSESFPDPKVRHPVRHVAAVLWPHGTLARTTRPSCTYGRPGSDRLLASHEVSVGT